MFINTTVSEIDKKNGFYLPTGTPATAMINVMRITDITTYKTGSRFAFLNSISRRSGRIKATCSSSVADIRTAMDTLPPTQAVNVSYFPKDDITKTAITITIATNSILLAFPHTNLSYCWLYYETGNDTKRVVLNDTLNNIYNSISWDAEAPTLLTATTISDTQVDLSLTENGTGFDGYSWERSEDLGVNYVEIGTTLIGDIDTSDITFTKPMILKYRARAYKGTQYSPYTSVVTIYPSGVRITDADSCIVLADPSSEFYFSDGAGNDDPFTVLAIAKLNSTGGYNRVFTRGTDVGTSFYCGINNPVFALDMAIYSTNSLATDVIYRNTNGDVLIDTNVHRFAFTYSGNNSHTGMEIYMDGILKAAGASTNTYGTYSGTYNAAGVHVGQHPQASYVSDADIYLIIICDKELSQAEVTEFQSMATEADISSLSFYANIKTINRFAGELTDDLDVHNGTSTDPAFFFMNNLIDTGETVLPSVIKTDFQDIFEDFKLGWFICYGIETYNGDETNGRTVITSLTSVFAAPSTVDVGAWATKAAESGKIDYAILTVSHIYGFSLYDHKTAVWEGSQIDVGGGIIVPTYTKYDVGSAGCTADKNIVTKFISEFNTVGIKPILYVCVGWTRNWAGQEFVSDGYTDPNYQFYYYHRLVRMRLQELARLNPFAIWIDVDCYYAPGYQQDLYDAIKAINKDIGVIVNVWQNQDRIDNSYGAMDSASVEESDQPALPNDDWWVEEQVINGITYPCVKELCCTSRIGNTWFYHNPPATLKTLVDIQAEYDYAKLAGVPLSVSINTDFDGVIDANQAALIANIVL